MDDAADCRLGDQLLHRVHGRSLPGVSAGLATVDALFDALRASVAADDEGGLSILDHSLQCAARLAVSHPDDVELQVAGLVHDLGWLDADDGRWSLRADAAHDVDGRALVEGLLGPRVGVLVGGHVAAKRYLLATDPTYRAQLSARSEVTLGFQGGVMTPAECRAFAARRRRRRPRHPAAGRRRRQGARRAARPARHLARPLTDLALRNAAMRRPATPNEGTG